MDEEIRVKTWQERLFELIKRGHGYVACPGGTGTLVELAVVWEMLNKGAMKSKPLVVLGDFWQPMIECVREVELRHASRWGERDEPLVHSGKLSRGFGRLPCRSIFRCTPGTPLLRRAIPRRAEFPQATGLQSPYFPEVSCRTPQNNCSNSTG